MKSRLLCALIAAVLCPLLSATTTVTGSIKTLGGTSANNSFVRFWLRGCNGNQPRVNGVAIMPSNTNGQFYFDFPSSSTGTITGLLYSTRDAAGTGAGEIDCGGSHTAAWYGMQVFRNSVGGPETPIHAKNTVTLDISTVTPTSTQPVVVAPTGDSTYLRLDAGNSPISGPLTISSTTTMNGATAINAPVTVTNSGVFTTAQLNDYVTSLVGGIAASIYHNDFGLVGFPTEAGHFGLAIPSNATIIEGDALVGEVTTSCNSVGRTICNAVAVGGHAEALSNGSAAFAGNDVVQDGVGSTGASITGREIDTVVQGSPALADGLDIFLWPRPGSTTPTNTASNALKIARGQNNGQWGQGIYIIGTSINPTGNAIYIDPACTAGPCSSAKITLGGLDAGSIPRFGTLSVNQNGGIILTSTAGQPVVITSDGIAIPGSSSGTITLKNQSAAVGGTMLLPSPVGSGVLAQLIGSGTATTAGTAIGSGAAQSITVTVTGAATTDVATCSTNAAYGSNWAFISVLPPIVTADTVTLNIVNPSAGSVTPAAQTFRCAVRR